MVKCTRSVGVASRRCKGRNKRARKKCMKRVMCGPKKRRRRKRR